MRGFTAGVFDLLHAGHIFFLQECKKNCDYLMVGIQVNPNIQRASKNKPIQSILERGIQLRACQYVDGIVVYETEQDLEIILNNFNLDIRFLGDDYLKEGNKITAEEAVPIKYIPRNHPYSSSELRERIENGES